MKTIIARSRCSVAEAVYWYNMSPRDSCRESTTPASQVYRYRIRTLRSLRKSSGESAVVQRAARYRLGDTVWVRRRGSRCDSRSSVGTVSRVVSEQCVEVDGVPYHVRNLRLKTSPSSRHVTQAFVEVAPSALHVPVTPSAASSPPFAVPPDESAEPAEALPSRCETRLLRANPRPRQLSF